VTASRTGSPNAADHPDRARRYPSDTTDAQWAVLREALPLPAWMEGRGGRPESHCHRQLIDAVFYLVDNGIKWRAMPGDFPAWEAVYAFFGRWRDHQMIAELHHRLRGKVRQRAGRDARPSAGIIDAQSVRAAATVPQSTSGFDGAKKVPGRERHVVVDTLGLLLAVMVTAASLADRDAAGPLLAQTRAAHHRLELIWADGAYTGECIEYCAEVLGLAIEVVTRPPAARGFVLLPRRRVVERTFAHLMRTRRLVRDYERLPESTEAMVWWSMVGLMMRRLARVPA
jgi:transposase